jgi:hypothetical protein
MPAHWLVASDSRGRRAGGGGGGCGRCTMAEGGCGRPRHSEVDMAGTSIDMAS